MERHVPGRGPSLLIFALLGAALVPVAGCGGGARDGQFVQEDPEIQKKNQDRGEQIRKEMEAKYKTGKPGR